MQADPEYQSSDFYFSIAAVDTTGTSRTLRMSFFWSEKISKRDLKINEFRLREPILGDAPNVPIIG